MKIAIWILTVHRIDYYKANCSENNLITLCSSCNIRANYERDKLGKLYKHSIELLC